MEHKVHHGACGIWWHNVGLRLWRRLGVQVHRAGNRFHPDQECGKFPPHSTQTLHLVARLCFGILTVFAESLLWVHVRQLGGRKLKSKLQLAGWSVVSSDFKQGIVACFLQTKCGSLFPWLSLSFGCPYYILL